MSDMIERVAKAILRQRLTSDGKLGEPFLSSDVENHWQDVEQEARAAVAIVIEDCANVALSESPGTTDGDWVAERIAHRIRSAPEDSKAHSELEKLALT